jgi:hypothetical protein
MLNKNKYNKLVQLLRLYIFELDMYIMNLLGRSKLTVLIYHIKTNNSG